MIGRTAVAAALAAVAARAQPSPLPHPRGYVCVRAQGPIGVDGRLDEAAWQSAPWSDDFVDIEGDIRAKPPLRTRIKMLWDDQYFYVGAELVEPNLWATQREHDSVIFHENDFELFMDPNGDNHEYYEFEINALNTGWDLLLPRPYKDGGHAVDNWEISGLKTAVHLDGTLNDPTDTDRGWTIEIAAPWKALGELARRPAPPRDGDQWRVNFSRVEWDLLARGRGYRKVEGRSEHNWVWSPQHVIDMHRPETWGYVQFEHAARRFVDDATWPARRWLQSVYYAEREFRKTHGRWTESLQDLGIAPPAEAMLSKPAIEATTTLFEVSISVTLPGGEVERWRIRQDALIEKGSQ